MSVLGGEGTDHTQGVTLSKAHFCTQGGGGPAETQN